FALFVGLAVLAVGLYVAFVLRGETYNATREMLYSQGERIADQLEQTRTPEAQLEIARTFSRLTDLRITIANRDSVVWDVHGNRVLSDGRLLEQPEMQPGRPVRFAERTEADGRLMLYVTLHRPNSGIIVRVGQPEPPLFSLVHQMQIALVVGMVMALLLALLGSWVASHQVTTPLQAIRNSARRIAEGDFGAKIRVESRAAEFQELATSLNRMSDSFRRQINELQRLTQIQNEFIGNVGHEVRNPIFAVSGYLEALGSGTLTSDMRKRYAEKGLTNLHRLQNLFNDLIEIARLEYREDVLKPAVFDLEELLEEVADMLRPKAEHKGLNFEVENQHLFVEADRNRLRQVLTNLIDNAIAYTDEGAIRCRFRRRLDKVRVEVIDTGRGIAEEHLERIFERFYRVDPDRSRRSGGTGLGLSIVHQILHAHGEQIHVESTVNRGTRFWFELPYAEVPETVA
ncbi:MAG: HAMP domain-containing sensor histidine kinase, partial [Rhodothermales bacterium]